MFLRVSVHVVGKIKTHLLTPLKPKWANFPKFSVFKVPWYHFWTIFLWKRLRLDPKGLHRCTLIQNKTVSFKKSKIQSCSESKITLITSVKNISKYTETLLFCSRPQNYTPFYPVKVVKMAILHIISLF